MHRNLAGSIYGSSSKKIAHVLLMQKLQLDQEYNNKTLNL
jgi:hypothetical protein